MPMTQKHAESIPVFLNAISRAFSDGQLDLVAEAFIFPTILYLGRGLIYLESGAAMCREFQTYRENLVEQGFDGADVHIAGREILGEQRVKLTLEWTNRSKTGVIGVVQLIAFCTRNKDRQWRIELLEMPKENQPQLARGLSII